MGHPPWRQQHLTTSSGRAYRGFGRRLVQVLPGPLPDTHDVTVTVVDGQQQVTVGLKGVRREDGDMVIAEA